jgi:SH3-like domain-containing protein
MIAATYGGALLWHAERRALDAIVLEQADARREPADRAPLTESLAAGSKVSIISAHGAWTFVRLPGGQKGWVKSSAVELVKPASTR